ncbi:MAG: hypothetical protein K1000chlam2_01343 [Chlamydiae bacterium]|nr:hypothetical protein [Chlamydiota bacterium]
MSTTKTIFSSLILSILFMCKGNAEEIEILSLDVISYEDFAADDARALIVLEKALHEKGIVGIRGVPGYVEKVSKFIEASRAFSALPEEIKETYAPNREGGDLFLGYEKGKERFMRPDGTWVIDDLKTSFYVSVPDNSQNIWPVELNLKDPFQALALLMSDTTEAVMEKIGLLGEESGVFLNDEPRMARMLYYRKSIEGSSENPLWCGAHFDHGIFTALIPAFYFVDGEVIPEPEEAGLFVKETSDGVFKKVVANDPEVMLFQVGEFGQLVTNDAIRATEHRVEKAMGCVERYTLALFFNAPMDIVIHSNSELTKDARYGGIAGDPCSFDQWNKASFDRYLVKEEE